MIKGILVWDHKGGKKLFESQGYFATTIEQITIEAGVSKGLVYNYFESKEELLAGLIEETTGKMQSIAETLDLCTLFDKSLVHFIDSYLKYLNDGKNFSNCSWHWC